ncbi:MAG: MarR family transcriptional regulator [Hyphomonas sp.]|jgi:DNA-binding MarR family transcriptional regulator|nr:MarR family transcriptional regulator [Hyphomonas sp.]
MNAPVNLVSTSTTHLLHRAGQLAEDLFARSIGEIGLTARQFVVLSVVETLDDPSQTALCEISGIDRSTLADIVRRLVSRGLLSRRRTRQDARMYAVRITPEGQEILQRALPIAQKVDQALVESLSPEQREQFGAFLQKVVARQGARPHAAETQADGPMRQLRS